MQSDYQFAKIYKIQPTVDHEENEIYIGSTLKYLKDRFNQHLACYNLYLKQNKKTANVRSFQLFEKYGSKNCEIVLIEEYPCECKSELRLREGQIVKTIPNINHNIPGQTMKEYYQNKRTDKQLYYQQNREKKLAYQKLYHDRNKSKIKEYLKQYRTRANSLNKIRFCNRCF